MVRQTPEAACPASPIMCVTPAAQPQKKCQRCWREEPVHVTDTIAYYRISILRPACPKWQAGFTVIPNIFLFLLSDQRLYIVNHMSTYTAYTDIRRRRNGKWITTATKWHTNREPCEVFTGYLSMECMPGGEWANMWHWTKRFTISFSNRKW